MTDPQDSPGNPQATPGDGDLYRVCEPVEPQVRPEFVDRYMRLAEAPRASVAEGPPPAPRRPMLSGVFTFPWYVQSLASWVIISLGMVVTGWLLLWLLGPGVQMGLLGARLLGPPVCAAGALTLSYAFACCLDVIEETANGWDSVQSWPDINWKEWVWSYAYVTALILEAALFGLALRLVTASTSWLPLIVGTLVAFPVVLLGALAAGSAWAPLAVLPVLRSFRPLWRAWGILYAATAAMVVGWTALTAAGLRWSPWLVPLYSGPALAAVMLIYARLIGRLAGLIGGVTDSGSDEEREAET